MFARNASSLPLCSVLVSVLVLHRVSDQSSRDTPLGEAMITILGLVDEVVTFVELVDVLVRAFEVPGEEAEP